MAGNDLVFYFAPHTRAQIVLWMLEELGVPYELRLLNRQKGDLQSPEFLAINPMAKVPAITHKGVPITETAAICAYLADAFPQAGLAPATDDPRRGTYLRWLVFSPGCIEPAVTDMALKREPGHRAMVAYGDFDSVVKVAAQVVSGGEYILGSQFSAADVVMGSMIRYGMTFGILPKLPEFVAYAERLAARSALRRSMARDEELAAQIAGS